MLTYRVSSAKGGVAARDTVSCLDKGAYALAICRHIDTIRPQQPEHPAHIKSYRDFKSAVAGDVHVSHLVSRSGMNEPVLIKCDASLVCSLVELGSVLYPWPASQ